jgi:hypothetical protein
VGLTRRLLHKIEIESGARCLDIGAQEGLVSILLGRRGGEVVAYDRITQRSESGSSARRSAPISNCWANRSPVRTSALARPRRSDAKRRNEPSRASRGARRPRIQTIRRGCFLRRSPITLRPSRRWWCRSRLRGLRQVDNGAGFEYVPEANRRVAVGATVESEMI